MIKDSEQRSRTYITDDPKATVSRDNASSRGIQSIEIGFRLLQCLERAPGPLPLKALAAGAGLSASRARFYLVSFIRLGLISQDRHHGVYDLGPYARHLGLTAIRRIDVMKLSERPLRKLGETLREAVFMSVWGNRGPTIVVKIDGPQETPVSMRVGHVVPMLRSATGRVFLSHLLRSATEQALDDDLARITRERSAKVAATLANSLENVIRDCRASGYARSEPGLNIGFSTIAAPVFDYRSEIAAVISVVRMGDKVDSRLDTEQVPMLLETAGEISTALGFQRVD